MELIARVKALAGQYFEKVRAIRRHLHQNPELSFQEYNTSAYLQEALRSLQVPFTSGHVKTGIVAEIQGRNPSRKTILIRADMDALPIEEKNNVPYRSVNPGVMHACGHDVHSSVVLGAVMILQHLRDEFEGTVKVMFQPGEEVLPGGASLMIREGVLKDPPVQKALALHVFPSMACGKVGFRQGMYMASTDELYIRVTGKGGHAAMPSEYHNPLLAASAILLEIDKRFSAEHALAGTAGETIPTVVAFGKIEGKGATNVIPETVEIAGTLRTMEESWRMQMHNELTMLVRAVAESRHCKAELRIEKGYPVLFNNPDFTASCEQAAREFLGKDMVEELPLRMTAEDFAFISQAVPSCFFRLGTGNEAKGISSGVHTPGFDIDENALETGMGLMAWLAVCELRA
ncbi:MAG TPA: M20 family metallopeptidase [Bacteroidia bacterium]|nr:M20 family metallopeptidase [Bacteroidia bacterium]